MINSQLSTPGGLASLMLPEQSITNAKSSIHPAICVITRKAYYIYETFIRRFNARVLLINHRCKKRSSKNKNGKNVKKHDKNKKRL